MELLLAWIVGAPGIGFLLLGVVWLVGGTPSEKAVRRFSKLLFLSLAICSAVLLAKLIQQGGGEIQVPAGNWFAAGQYAFFIQLRVDWLSLPLITLTVILIGVISSFCARYLHRDPGFFRFFQLLFLFAFGSLLAFAASSYDLLLGGWELVGITSVMLIGFFKERQDPARNSLRVFSTYRIADIGLLLGIFVLHYTAHTAEFSDLASRVHGHQTLIGLLLLAAAAGKSAQFPFFGWLPRAMEGPTPSSAIFYGAISVHLGAYLLMRSAPVIQASQVATVAVVAVGAVTAFIATLIHRVATDAKGSLAYAAMAQLGIIFIEVGLGLETLALVHLLGHAAVRTLQFLRAPSMLHDYRRMHSATGGALGRTGQHYDRFVPAQLQAALYRIGLERGYFDAVLDRFIIRPVMAFAEWATDLEPGAREDHRASKGIALKRVEG